MSWVNVFTGRRVSLRRVNVEEVPLICKTSSIDTIYHVNQVQLTVKNTDNEVAFSYKLVQGLQSGMFMK